MRECELSSKALSSRINRMESRQAKEFNPMRANHIKRFRGLLATAIEREQNHPYQLLSDKASSGVNLSGPINNNHREKSFADQAVSRGWVVIKRGWPDFLCWKGNEVID